MNINTKNSARFIATFTLVAAFSAGAQAADAAQMQVKFDDLNLNSNAGANMLYQRIRGAAKDVCGVVGTQEVEKQGRARACVDHAVAKALAEVNSTYLQAASN